MRQNDMTLPELLAWRSGDFEEYKSLLMRKHWLESHIRGSASRMMDAEDSMSVFGEDEHGDERYLRYKADYAKACAKKEKWTAELSDLEDKLLKYMRASD